MAGEAPFHKEGLGFPNEGHLVHLPVTGRAADTFIHVDGMVEVNVIRQVMDAIPANWAS